MLEHLSFFTLLCIVLYYIYYRAFICRRPEIHTNNEKLKTILENVQSLKEKYMPPVLFFGGQLQTIWGLSKRWIFTDIPYQREIIELNDGGIVALDFIGDYAGQNRPLILFLPGLTSSSKAIYVQTLISAFFNSCDVIVFNYRGLGSVPFKTGRISDSSNTEDLKQVITHIQYKYKGRTLIAVGTSHGGVLLSKYLTTEQNIPFKYAMLISTMWNCDMGYRSLEKSFINLKFINSKFTEALIALSEKAAKCYENPSFLNMEEIRKCKTCREFDQLVTAPQNGFKTVTDYYEFSSTKDITKFPIPVIAISAADDPFQPEKLLPLKEIKEKHSNLALVKTSYGGHLGFLEGTQKTSAHYLERLCQEIMSEICKNL